MLQRLIRLREREDGIPRCPFCQGETVGVLDSRDDLHTGWRKRRRECTRCHQRWNTLEVPEEIYLQIARVTAGVSQLELDLTRLAKAMKTFAALGLGDKDHGER